ncbi:MAG: flagellar motor switch phosphatase FliY, partial [Bacilli bacterium]
EINALLRGESIDTQSEVAVETVQLPDEEYLTELEKDALGEVGNISFGNSATALSTLLNQKVDITTPTVSIIYYNDLVKEFPRPYLAVEVSYTTGLAGSNLLIIQKEDAAIIADLMLGGDGTNPDPNLNEIHLSAVQEAMNQMMGMSATSMSQMFGAKVDISPPTISEIDLPLGEGYDRIPNDDILARISFRLKVGELIDSSIMQLLPIDLAKKITNTLMNPKQEEQVSKQLPIGNVSQAAPTLQPVGQAVAVGAQPTPSIQQNEIQYEEAYIPPPSAVQQMTNVQPASFAAFDSATHNDIDARNLDMLYDIQLNVAVELGRTRKSIREILELSQGSIIELDKLAGEPVEILVANKLVARGEVVVIEENFGVRVTDIISRKDRLNNLR